MRYYIGIHFLLVMGYLWDLKYRTPVQVRGKEDTARPASDVCGRRRGEMFGSCTVH